MSMNSVNIILRLTQEPDLRFASGKGTAICTLNGAFDGPYRDENNKPKPGFVRVTVWGKQGESCANHLVKGQQIAVEGVLNWTQWEDQQGNKRSGLDIVADNFGVTFLAKPKGATGETASGSGTGNTDGFSEDGFMPVEDDDDIPF